MFADSFLFCFSLVATSSTDVLFDHLLHENFQENVFPHYWNPGEADQMTSCDFESPCSWTMSNHSGKGDWRVLTPNQHMTDMGVTMPPADHSVGSSNGHFLLLTAAAGQSQGSCQFSITSPVLHSSSSQCQLQLAWYHTDVDELRNLTIQVRAMDSSVSSLDFDKSWQKENSEQWEVFQAHIGHHQTPFQVMLLYSTCGLEDWGTLAIDSLQLKDCDTGDDIMVDCVEHLSFHCDMGNCIDQSRVCDFNNDCLLGEDEAHVCDALPLGSHCSFESGSCGWSISNSSSSWTLVRGQDLTTRDVLGFTLQNRQGHFLLLRVRDSSAGGVAVVQSPLLPSMYQSQFCQIQFSLYLYGEFNGTMLLSVEENGTVTTPFVREGTGQLQDHWLDVTLKLSGISDGFHLSVKAHWGPGSVADIALDQVTFGVTCFGIASSFSLPDTFFLLDVPSMTWWFTSCGASGPRGPTQAQCDSAYRNTNVSVTVGKEGSLSGVQMWRVPATNHYMISAYGAAGGKGAKNHNKRSHGIFISAIFPLEKGDILYILVGHQGEDACPGRNPLTQKICLGESSVIEDDLNGGNTAAEWAGGGGGGGGATYIYRAENGVLVPLLIAAGGGGKAYLEEPEGSLNDVPLELYENNTAALGTNGNSGAAGGGGGWKDIASFPWAGKSLHEGAEGGSSCPQALSKLAWATFGGFGGGGGACTAGGGGGGYRGGNAAPTDDVTADGQDGVSFIHPMGEIFLQPLAAMESHGEAEIKVHLNCSHCPSQSCIRDEETKITQCICDSGEVLASDNMTCTGELFCCILGTFCQKFNIIIKTIPRNPVPEGHLPLPLILAVVASTVVSGLILTCASLTLIYYRKKNQLHAARVRLQSPKYKLSKIRTSAIMTDYNPNYCFAGKVTSLNDLKEVPRKNITLLRALGHGAFGEVYEGQVFGFGGDNAILQVAIKTLPEICSEQDEMDFLMEALIMSKFSHQNIVRCIGVSLQTLPRFILLELMTGGDMKTFLRHNRPKTAQDCSLSMLDLLHMAWDIALGCRYLEENHFIHRDIAARNCLLTCSGPGRVAKIGDFGMARDIYRASYYRKGGRAMLPVKWMPPEAFLEGIFTCKTDTWSFGVLLWEIFSLGYMPYPCKTNQEVLEFVTGGGRMDPPKSCPGPVYRIMTQCWQHCPEHRPNFSTILERINYCTQDPDVINTPLPVECGPPTEEDDNTVVQRDGSVSMAPLLVTSSINPESPSLFLSSPLLSHGQKPLRVLQHPQQDRAAPREVLEENWVEAVSTLAADAEDQHPDQHTATATSNSGNQKLKNKTKNLWNPTYGSWLLESYGRGKTVLSQTRSMPTSPDLAVTPSSERDDSGFDGNGSSSPPSSHPSPSSPAFPASSPPSSPLGISNVSGHKGLVRASGSSTPGVDLAKLQSFPCGNINYAYDDPSYEPKNLPLFVAKVPEACSSPAPSTSGAGLGGSVSGFYKPLLKRHASYGHEDIKQHANPEKPARDRDSGFSLSEDLTVTPV
ncbi:leukocyte tyrosine kinase receptor-like [Arapaima gigas]